MVKKTHGNYLQRPRVNCPVYEDLGTLSQDEPALGCCFAMSTVKIMLICILEAGVYLLNKFISQNVCINQL